MASEVVEYPVTPDTLADIHLAVDSLPQNGMACVVIQNNRTKPTIRQRRGFAYWCRISAKSQGLAFEDAIVDGHREWGLYSQWKKKYLAPQVEETPLGKKQILWLNTLEILREAGESVAADMHQYGLSTTELNISKAQWKTAMEWIELDHQGMEIPLPVLDPSKSKFNA